MLDGLVRQTDELDLGVENLPANVPHATITQLASTLDELGHQASQQECCTLVRSP
jgi:hypothetical protein